ncbi:MAG: hypothetical protein ACMXYK_02225 [Candidatus Woesearchaeota archaeon]
MKESTFEECFRPLTEEDIKKSYDSQSRLKRRKIKKVMTDEEIATSLETGQMLYDAYSRIITEGSNRHTISIFRQEPDKKYPLDVLLEVSPLNKQPNLDSMSIQKTPTFSHNSEKQIHSVIYTVGVGNMEIQLGLQGVVSEEIPIQGNLLVESWCNGKTSLYGSNNISKNLVYRLFMQNHTDYILQFWNTQFISDYEISEENRFILFEGSSANIKLNKLLLSQFPGGFVEGCNGDEDMVQVRCRPKLEILAKVYDCGFEGAKTGRFFYQGKVFSTGVWPYYISKNDDRKKNEEIPVSPSPVMQTV